MSNESMERHENTLKEAQKQVEDNLLYIINTGSRKEVMGKVKGVGLKRATLILDYRELNGVFIEVFLINSFN